MICTITYDKDRVVEWTQEETDHSVDIWRKSPSIDKIVVESVGRNIHASNYNKFKYDVIHRLFDYRGDKKPRAPLEIVIACDHHVPMGEALDVVISPLKAWQYRRRHELQETYDAIWFADRIYAMFTGGILYSEAPLYQNLDLLKKLIDQLIEIKC